MQKDRFISWYLLVLTTERKTRVRGTIIHKPFFVPNHEKLFGHLVAVLTSFLAKPASHEYFQLEINDEVFSLKTDQRGGFELSLDKGRQLINNLIIKQDGRELDILFNHNYPSKYKTDASKFLVISDMDDTAIQSYTAKAFKRLRTILFSKPAKRKAVAFTKQFLNESALQGGFVYYVSRSETNLYGILTKVILNNDLPNGPILLAPFVSIKNLLLGVDKAGLKQRYIHEALHSDQKLPVVLIGDDTQEDLEIYSEVAMKFPHRVKCILIHQTTPIEKSWVVEKAKKIKETGVRVVYFKTKDDGIKMAKEMVELI